MFMAERVYIRGILIQFACVRMGFFSLMQKIKTGEESFVTFWKLKCPIIFLMKWNRLKLEGRKEKRETQHTMGSLSKQKKQERNQIGRRRRKQQRRKKSNAYYLFDCLVKHNFATDFTWWEVWETKSKSKKQIFLEFFFWPFGCP